MDHKHFQSAKRPFSVIFNSKPTKQVIRLKHEGQVSAKIMLEQKADFLKFDSNESTLVVEQQYKNVNEINRLNTLVNRKISLSFVRKHLYSIKDIIPVRGAGRSIIGGGGDIHIFVFFTINESRIYECCPPPNYRSSGASDCSDGLRDCGCFITFTTISTTTVI